MNKKNLILILLLAAFGGLAAYVFMGGDPPPPPPPVETVTVAPVTGPNKAGGPATPFIPPRSSAAYTSAAKVTVLPMPEDMPTELPALISHLPQRDAENKLTLADPFLDRTPVSPDGGGDARVRQLIDKWQLKGLNVDSKGNPVCFFNDSQQMKVGDWLGDTGFRIKEIKSVLTEEDKLKGEELSVTVVDITNFTYKFKWKLDGIRQ